MLMKCVVATSCGEPNEVIQFVNNQPKPTLDAKDTKHIIVRVMACSISPGDMHTLSGDMDGIVPISSFPYIVGMDLVGRVTESNDVKAFPLNARVMCTNGFTATGGMAEYAKVKTCFSTLVPENVDDLSAASSTSACAALTAILMCGRRLEGRRILVLGGSGGVGTAVVQLAKLYGASFVATTSTQKELMTSLGADCVIHYPTESWWERKDFHKNKMDMIIDCVGGNKHWSKTGRVLKSSWNGGKFIAVSLDDNHPVVHSTLQMVNMIFPMLFRMIRTFFSPWGPRYLMVFENGKKEEVLKLVSEKKLKIILDPASPFAFSEEGVKSAFTLIKSMRAHGKVVVQGM